jgi:hypothetical protein
MELHREWILILSPFIAAAIYPVSNVVQTFKWFFNIKRLKPFDCTKCLSFWICLMQGILFNISLQILIPLCFTSMFAGYLISKYITKQ